MAEKVLYLEDEQNSRRYLSEIIEDVGMTPQICTPESIEGAIGEGGVKAVLSDGLYGQWRDVRVKAVEHQIRFALITGTKDIFNAASDEGITAFYKRNIDLRGLKRFLQGE